MGKHKKHSRAKKPAPLPISRNPLPWLRGLGFVSMAFGGLGLIQYFFWPSVSFFYLGLVVLCVDLWFERLAMVWKASLGGIVGVIGMLFFWYVVLRTNPISVTYRLTDTNLVDLYVQNDSSDDYQDMDLTLSTDDPNAHFDQLKNVSDFPSLTVVDQGWKLTQMQEALIYSDGRDWHMTRPTLRVRCSLLPKRSSVHVLLSLVTGSPSGMVAALKWKKLMLSGEFKGKFKTVSVSEIGTRGP
jgi:hypothetical protein